MEDLKKAFDAVATGYDSRRELVIPEFQPFYSNAVWAAESSVSKPVILDIGAGTGLLSSLVLQKFPDAHMTLLDISENMLEIARWRFAASKNITYIVSDYSQGIPPGPYDLVCSALSIHHLATDNKWCLFSKIFSTLKEGGLFANADQADDATLIFMRRYLGYWNEFLNRGPMNDVERTGILKRCDTLDRNEKLLNQLLWLKECGFSDVDVIYRNRTFIVTVARKGN